MNVRRANSPRSFREVGKALMEIRDEEQYRERGFGGFVEYLQSKSWGIDQSYAYRQINAAKVHELVSPIGEINESQARELAPLLKKSTPEIARQVYTEVLEEAGDPVKVREISGIPETVNPRQLAGMPLGRTDQLVS